MPEQHGVFRYEDTALILIDYQVEMFQQVTSESPAEMIDFNTRMLIKAAKAFGMPIVLSTVGVALGVNQPTRPSVRAELPGLTEIDRSTMNAWDDPVFREAVRATGRRRLIVGALFTEICLAFPVVDMLKDGYDVAIPVDAVGGVTQLAHATAIQRLVHAGAAPTTTLAITTELFRDWTSPVADKARTLIVDYLAKYPDVAAGRLPAA